MENISGRTSAAKDSINSYNDYSIKLCMFIKIFNFLLHIKLLINFLYNNLKNLDDSFPFPENDENWQTTLIQTALKSNFKKPNQLSTIDYELPTCSKYFPQNHVSSPTKHLKDYPFSSVDHLPDTSQDIENVKSTTTYNKKEDYLKQPHHSSQIIVSSKPLSTLTMKSADQQLTLSSSTTSVSYSNKTFGDVKAAKTTHETANKIFKLKRFLDEEFNEEDQIIPTKFNATVSKISIENSKEFVNKCIRTNSTKVPPKIFPKSRPNCSIDSIPPLPSDLLQNEKKSKQKYQNLISPVAEEASQEVSSTFSSSLDALDDETLQNRGHNSKSAENKTPNDAIFVRYRGPGVTDV